MDTHRFIVPHPHTNQCVTRCIDESNDEDAQGVHNTMAVIENLVEIVPDIGTTICHRTDIFKVLLQRVKAKKFDANKLYASELLSILLQSSPHEEASDPDTGEVRATLQTLLCNLKLQEKDDVSDGMVVRTASSRL